MKNQQAVSAAAVRVQVAEAMKYNPPSLDICGAAVLLNCSVAALRAWRVQGDGPATITVGRATRYRLDDLRAFQAARPATP